jgi:hypothetical protein
MSNSEERRAERKKRKALVGAAIKDLIEDGDLGPRSGELRGKDLGSHMVAESMHRRRHKRGENTKKANWFRDFLIRNDYQDEDYDWLLAPGASGGLDHDDRVDLDSQERKADLKHQEDGDLSRRADEARSDEISAARRDEDYRRYQDSHHSRRSGSRDSYEFDRDYGRSKGWSDDEY